MLNDKNFLFYASGSNKTNILKVCLAMSAWAIFRVSFLNLSLNSGSDLVGFESNDNVS